MIMRLFLFLFLQAVWGWGEEVAAFDRGPSSSPTTTPTGAPSSSPTSAPIVRSFVSIPFCVLSCDAHTLIYSISNPVALDHLNICINQWHLLNDQRVLPNLQQQVLPRYALCLFHSVCPTEVCWNAHILLHWSFCSLFQTSPTKGPSTSPSISPSKVNFWEH